MAKANLGKTGRYLGPRYFWTEHLAEAEILTDLLMKDPDFKELISCWLCEPKIEFGQLECDLQAIFESMQYQMMKLIGVAAVAPDQILPAAQDERWEHG